MKKKQLLCCFTLFISFWGISSEIEDNIINLNTQNKSSTNLTKSSSENDVVPTRILDSKSLHIELPTPRPDTNDWIVYFEDKEDLKIKYFEWYYNSVLQL